MKNQDHLARYVLMELFESADNAEDNCSKLWHSKNNEVFTNNIY